MPAYLLPRAALPRPARYVPHIYTDRELAALFAQTDRCHYCAEVPARHLVMPVLFRTIYGCGLRCSEARLLRVADVDLDTGVLQIRDAKGGKDRQVPVCDALRERLAGYHAQVAGRPDREWFFPGRGRPAADARQRLPQLPPVPLAGAASPTADPGTAPGFTISAIRWTAGLCALPGRCAWWGAASVVFSSA